MEEIPELYWVWNAMDFSITRLFNDKGIADAFCEFDFPVLRVTPFSICIPPPTPEGTTKHEVNIQQKEIDESEILQIYIFVASIVPRVLQHTEGFEHIFGFHMNCYIWYFNSLRSQFVHIVFLISHQLPLQQHT
jgi:hypothetical protein